MAYREILFRGKAAEKQVSNSVKSIDEIFPDGWVYGFYCPEMCDHPFGKVKPDPHIIATGAPDKILTGMWFEVNEDTVGQYTGLTDKNGKKIFEGDIVKLQGGGGLLCFGKKEFIGVVCHANGGGTRSTISRTYVQPINDGLNEADYSPETMEVIGNVYDNPELLEV